VETMTISYCTISGTVLDGAGNPLANATIIFDSLIPQTINGQYIQPVSLSSLTDDSGVMIPVELAQGLSIQVTVNAATPCQCTVPYVGALSFGTLVSNTYFIPTADATTFSFFEDFPASSLTSGQVGTNGWTVQSIGGSPTLTFVDAGASHFGIYRLTTPASSGQGGALSAAPNTAIQLTTGLASLETWKACCAFRLGQTGTTRLRVGLLNDFATGPSATFMGVQYDTNAGDTYFQFVCSDSSVATSLNTHVLGDTGWHTLRMWSAVAGTILFSLDGGVVQTISTNVPSADLTPSLQILADTAAAMSADIDFFSLLIPTMVR
jgi:hypothetical protein